MPEKARKVAELSVENIIHQGMKSFRIETTVAMPAEQVWQHFNRELFEHLKPGWMSLLIVRFDGCRTGDEFVLKIGPLRQIWHGKVSQHFESDSIWFFIDEGIRLPFPLRVWKHKHQIQDLNDHTLIIDDISFSTGFVLADFVLALILRLMFSSRSKTYRRLFGRP